MPTPSHIVLGLPELILIILENVLPSDKLQVYCRCSARPTLAAAARVCKAWTAPASIVLWRSLDTLVPLLKLLPTAKFVGLDGTDSDSDTDDDLDHDSALILADDVSREDWQRFMYYAALVRVVDLGFCERSHSRNVVVDPFVYEYLSHMNDGKPLLPRLREISWYQKGSSDRTIIYLLSPTVRRLHIRTKDGSDTPRMVLYRSRFHRSMERRRYKEPRRRDHVLRWILREGLPKAVNLEHMTLDGVHHPAILVPVSKCTRLETLELRSSLENSTIDVPQLIATLGGLTTLTRLTMPVDQMWDIEDDALRPVLSLFENMGTLNLSTKIGRKPQPPALMFSTADCQRLQKLSIDFDTEDADKSVQSSDLRQLLRLPPGFAHLCTFHFRFDKPVGWSSTPLRLSDFLLPLATLHNLQHLYMVCEETLFACTDEDIRLITRNWPNITTFAATFTPQDGHPSVRALKHITQGWPRLEVLCLPCLRDLADFDKNIRPHTSLRRIGILSFLTHQGGTEVGNFAIYLSLQFPNLLTERPSHMRLGGFDYEWKPCHSWWKILEVVKQARLVIQQRYNLA